MRKILCLIMIIMCLVFVGCAEKITGQPVKEDILKVGFIGPLTGDAAFIGEPIRKGVELAASDLEVEMFYQDGRCNGKDALGAYRTLRDVHKVDAIIVVCSPELLAIAPVAELDGVLVISPSATAPSITDAGEHVFRLAPSDALQGKVGAKLMVEKGFSEIAILHISHDYGVGLRDVVKAEIGDKIFATESFEPDSKDFRTQLTKIKDVDAIYLVAFPKDAALALKQIKEMGIEAQVVAVEGAKDSEVLPFGEGILITVPMAEGDKYSDFAAKYLAKFGEDPKLYSGEAYDTMNVVALAAEKSDDVVEGMKLVKSFDGVAGTVVFDAFGDIEKPYDLFTVEGGAFVKVQ
ncbi:ABC transporter substrate-binding protein [Candidatus Woesearchaeota archaeon]|jgi:branched-chain amino acid transport system substrate-binding protein|nr:ABC transporter substrate-binding protein [Candidatus Woesearchaeota archaeon]MBT3537128.1 ABC transporter substrate-binding protein [Candidatus Woesearchaeota archaeon]MBT4716550.1 ABC transporter substrate-binding protein [Candidatus Woesearchaeota archaeon]MBT7106562.1 ABC transporter substrate-binding protein [Candidatus Woesearchaeota archaeon]MBT7931063.1 ABC transporter substrate-binding protein [Candidatus Woesearchaeota archaeon]